MPTNPTHKDDVRPIHCPFCASADTHIYSGHGGKKVQCLTCGASGVSLDVWNTRAVREADDSPAIPEEPFPKWDVCRDCCDGSHAGLKCTVCDGKGHVPFKPTPASHTAPDALRDALIEARQWVEASTAQVRGLSAIAALPGETMLKKIDAALDTPAPSRDEVERDT